jgi:hypothetical protein
LFFFVAQKVERSMQNCGGPHRTGRNVLYRTWHPPSHIFRNQGANERRRGCFGFDMLRVHERGRAAAVAPWAVWARVLCRVHGSVGRALRGNQRKQRRRRWRDKTKGSVSALPVPDWLDGGVQRCNTHVDGRQFERVDGH